MAGRRWIAECILPSATASAAAIWTRVGAKNRWSLCENGSPPCHSEPRSSVIPSPDRRVIPSRGQVSFRAERGISLCSRGQLREESALKLKTRARFLVALWLLGMTRWAGLPRRPSAEFSPFALLRAVRKRRANGLRAGPSAPRNDTSCVFLHRLFSPSQPCVQPSRSRFSSGRTHRHEVMDAAPPGQPEKPAG